MASPITHTRLRKVYSKDPDNIEMYVNTLPYRIEIKEISYCQKGNKWFLWFIPPDEELLKEFPSGDLD